MQVVNLPPPHGDCLSEWLKYSFYDQKEYSRTKCRMDQKSAHVNATCGCREFYMPPMNGVGNCSLETYIDCAMNAERKRDGWVYSKWAKGVKCCEIPTCRKKVVVK